jgi:hypothetical protein
VQAEYLIYYLILHLPSQKGKILGFSPRILCVCVYSHNSRGSFGQLWKGKFLSVSFVEHLTSSCTILWMLFSKWVEDQNINPEFRVSIRCLRYTVNCELWWLSCLKTRTFSLYEAYLPKGTEITCWFPLLGVVKGALPTQIQLNFTAQWLLYVSSGIAVSVYNSTFCPHSLLSYLV